MKEKRRVKNEAFFSLERFSQLQVIWKLMGKNESTCRHFSMFYGATFVRKQRVIHTNGYMFYVCLMFWG